MYDFIIIGAGVVGGLIARELSRYDVKICILEKENDVASGTTKANSAIVHAGFDAKNGSLKAKLNVRGSVLMEDLCRELGVKYKRNGSLVVGFNKDDMKIIGNLYERGIKNGVEGLFLIDADEVKKMEPEIKDDVLGALYAPTGAIVCPYELCISAIGNAMDNGAELKTNFKVTKIEEGATFKVYSDNDFVMGKFLINAAGLFSDEIAKMCGNDSFEIIPKRGEYILLDKECSGIVKKTIFRSPSKAGKGVLISPTVDGNIILGPTSDVIDNKNDLSVTKEGLAKIIESERETVKILPLNKSITSFSGLRASTKKGDFIIEKERNIIHLCGIESPGLSAAPAIAEYVIEIIKKEGLLLCENKSFNPNRRPYHYFKDLPDDEKNKIIKENPQYGRIICRCEEITEGEIVEAITRNPKATDLDGVKRRTRSRMGRCQGGFCSPNITEIIARELGVSQNDVTKFGGNSKIITRATKNGGQI